MFILKAIQTELISRHYNNPLVSHFDIKKTCELLAQKYYWPIFRRNVEAYINAYDVCLALKTVRHKPYNNLQLLLIPIHH